MNKIFKKFFNEKFIIGAIVVLLISSYLEFLYGSIYLGIIFLTLFIILIFFLPKDIEAEKSRKNSLLAVLGIVIVISVIIYNYLTNRKIGNLDVMTAILGISLILMNSSNKDVLSISKFSAWLSSFFISSFALLYSAPHYFGIPFPYYYGHYFVALPVVSILRILGLNVSARSMRMINVEGIEPVNLKIELSCFGWYSMLLSLGTIFSYHMSIKKIDRRKLIVISLIVFFASYLANLLRVTILVVLTYFYGVDTMLMFHPHLGWILFASILIPLIYKLIK